METGIEKFKEQASLPSEGEFENLRRQADIFLKSGFLPSSIKTPEQAITIAIKGRELGIPPMQAFSHINVIQGKPAMSAELMLALCFRGCPTAVIEFVQNDNKACAIDSRRRATDKPSRFKFDLDDATVAGLLGKDSWKKFPAAMLRARCISAMGRAMFPDCLMGVSYTAEELGAEVDDEGKILKPAQVVEEPKPATQPAAPVELTEAEGIDAWKEQIYSCQTIGQLESIRQEALKELDEAGVRFLKPHFEKALEVLSRKASKPAEPAKAPEQVTPAAAPATSGERLEMLRAGIRDCETERDLNAIMRTLKETERKLVMDTYQAKVKELKKAVNA